MSKKKTTKRTIKTKQPEKKAAGQYTSLRDPRNIGLFRNTFPLYAVRDADKTVTPSDRKELVGLSRQLFSQMGELKAATKQKASWVVGGGFAPYYNGSNTQWSDATLTWFAKWTNTCTDKGLALDWLSCWKLASRKADEDGDMGMMFLTTRNGWPRLKFIETHAIGQRDSAKTVSGGKYDGYNITDGVITTPSGTPVAYNILGADKEDDFIVTAQQMALIVDPEFFSSTSGRGLPVMSAAISDAQNYKDIIFYQSAVVKRDASIQIINTNQTGFAPMDEGNGFAPSENNCAPEPNPNDCKEPAYNPIPLQLVSAGDTFLKANSGEKLEPFLSNRPAAETQAFVKSIEKKLLAAIGWPHEILLSPEDVGGASVRGLAQNVGKIISERQTLLEKYAKIAFLYAVAVAMENGIIPTNYDEDWTNWSFSRGPVLTLDEGYSRDADRKDVVMGLKTMDDIARKNGTNAVAIRKQLSIETADLLNRAIELNKEFPQFDVNRCLDLLSQRGANYLPAVSEPEPPALSNSDKGKSK